MLHLLPLWRRFERLFPLLRGIWQGWRSFSGGFVVPWVRFEVIVFTYLRQTRDQMSANEYISKIFISYLVILRNAIFSLKLIQLFPTLTRINMKPYYTWAGVILMMVFPSLH